MPRSIDTVRNIGDVVRRLSKQHSIVLNEDATTKLFPNLHIAIQRHNYSLPPHFSVIQDGYEIQNPRVTNLGRTYIVHIYYVGKTGERQEAEEPAPHRRRHA